MKSLPWGAPDSWRSLMRASDKYSFHWWVVLIGRIAPMTFPYGEYSYWARWQIFGDFERAIILWHSLMHVLIGFALGFIDPFFVVGFAIGKETEDAGNVWKKFIDITSFTFGALLSWLVRKHL